MIVQYNGRNYNGFQKQKNGNTIQNELENALKIITKQEVNCVGSGRTDAMVSAYMQPVHFDIEKEINTEKVMYSLNGILKEDIRVLSLKQTTIHARFSAKKKTYLYKMYLSQVDLPLNTEALRLSPNLNIKAMKRFVRMLKGTHNFDGFKASGSDTQNSVRTIYKARLRREGIFLNFYITGNGFLYKMVRNIVGTMLDVGEGKISLKQLKQELFTTYKCKHTAKPEYLYLLNVQYE